MVRNVPQSWIAILVALAAMCGAQASIAVVDAQAAPVIKKKEIEPTALKLTKAKCFLDQFIRSELAGDAPIQVYFCKSPRVRCHVGPPLKTNIGLCVGAYELDAVGDILVDQACTGAMYFKRETYGVRGQKQKGSWECHGSYYNPPA